MVTYGDGVADLDIGKLVSFHRHHGKLATVTAVRPSSRYGELSIENGMVSLFREKPQVREGWINGGFFVFEPQALDLITSDGDSLEQKLLVTLANARSLPFLSMTASGSAWTLIARACCSIRCGRMPGRHGLFGLGRSGFLAWAARLPDRAYRFQGWMACGLAAGNGGGSVRIRQAAGNGPILFRVMRPCRRMESRMAISVIEARCATIAQARPTVIFHLAAQPLVRRSYREPIETFADQRHGYG